MAEYLAPGVYVEDYDSATRPIPGVSVPIDDATARRLVESLKAIVPLTGPEWARFNHSDPGITLIELFAWLGESLLYGTDDAYGARRDAARRAFVQLLTAGCAPACAPLQRPRFFAGQMLDAATLAAEQEYQRDRLRRHNRALHGVGVVSGLDVQVGASDDKPHVTIEPGYAIDPCGDELAVCERAMIRLPLDAGAAFVSLRRWERARDPVPGPNGPEATRIEEACIVAVSARVPATAVALAHLTRDASGWSSDANFARSTAGSTGRGDAGAKQDP